MKTIVYWVGLILIGFSLWASFVGLWVFLSRYPWQFGDYRVGVLINLLVGAIIFTVIGWRMMKEGEMT
jgi:hypothetical protein